MRFPSPPVPLRHFRVELRGRTWAYILLDVQKTRALSGFTGFWRAMGNYQIRPIPSDSKFYMLYPSKIALYAQQCIISDFSGLCKQFCTGFWPAEQNPAAPAAPPAMFSKSLHF